MAAPTAIQYINHSASPYSVQLKVSGGAGGASLFAINDFVAVCAEGPLKKTLQQALPTAVADFNVDQARGSEIRIYDNPADTVAPRLGRTIKWVSGATAAIAGLSCDLADTGILIIEIRLNHSTQA